MYTSFVATLIKTILTYLHDIDTPNLPETCGNTTKNLLYFVDVKTILVEKHKSIKRPYLMKEIDEPPGFY